MCHGVVFPVKDSLEQERILIVAVLWFLSHISCFFLCHRRPGSTTSNAPRFIHSSPAPKKKLVSKAFPAAWQPSVCSSSSFLFVYPSHAASRNVILAFSSTTGAQHISNFNFTSLHRALHQIHLRTSTSKFLPTSIDPTLTIHSQPP